MNYSIVMPYYNRISQLRNTLASFDHHYSDRDDWEVIIVIDGKNSDAVHDLINEFTEWAPIATRMNIRTTTVDFDTYNPSPLYNVGVSMARGRDIILTSPEVAHASDILMGIDAERVRSLHSYIVCACESAKQCGAFKSALDFPRVQHRWYQHSQHRNAMYHFCTVIPADAYLNIGGFNEAYKDGIAYDDDSFLLRVRKSGMPIVVRDDLVSVHQEHGKLSSQMPRSEYMRLLTKNKQLFEMESRP